MHHVSASIVKVTLILAFVKNMDFFLDEQKLDTWMAAKTAKAKDSGKINISSTVNKCAAGFCIGVYSCFLIFFIIFVILERQALLKS